ncbi:lamin tail domain-containing protein [Candidatus Woesearchaeota archaeon]|nr:lamin tail domain-containing protein [Candidatus Woesearchaeota archaeon]
MDKCIVFILILLAGMPATAGHLVIEEVLYDPATESGGEAVLLRNPDNVSVDLSGWTLMTETSAADATLPPGSFLPAFGTFLIADAGWELLKGDLPSADHEESLTLTNTNAGVALKDASGTIVDAVGWGNAADIKDGLFEGAPHNGTTEGLSLRRTQDTDDNLADFIAAEPSFVVVTDGIEVPIELTLDGGLGMTVFAPASFTSIPGELGNLTIRINTTTPAFVLVEGFNQTIDASTSDGLQHAATIAIPYWQPPGDYSVHISSGNQTLNRSITILPVTSIGIDALALFASLTPGGVHSITGDTDMTTPDRPTLINNGNTFADVIITATTPAQGSLTFALSNIKYGLGTFNATVLKATQIKHVRLAPRETLPLSLWIAVPMLDTGRYEGMLTIAGKESK